MSDDIRMPEESELCTLCGFDPLDRRNEDDWCPACALQAESVVCTLPPNGWRCTRGAGHDGPCAAVPDSPLSASPAEDAGPRACVSLNYDYCAKHDAYVNPRFGCYWCRLTDAARHFLFAWDHHPALSRSVASAIDELRVALPRATPSSSPGGPRPTLLERSADRLAYEVKRLVERRVIDARSPAGDALLDYAGVRYGEWEAITAIGVPPLSPPASDGGTVQVLEQQQLEGETEKSASPNQPQGLVLSRDVMGAARAFVAAYDALRATELYTTRQHHVATFDRTLAELRAVIATPEAP